MLSEKISLGIALCCYNGAQFIAEQLQSIAGQTRLPDRLVVVDDQSQDATVDLVRTFAAGARFPVQLTLNEHNLGVAKNFEKAIGLCDTDIILLSDQDDVWYPHKLCQIEAAFLHSPETAMVFSNGEIVDGKLRPMGYTLWEAERFTPKEQKLTREGRIFEVLLKHNVITGCTMAFRKEFKNFIFPISEKFVHDSWIGLLISAVGKLVMIPECLIRYRQHDHNQLGAKKINVLDRIMLARTMGRACHIAELSRYQSIYEHLLGKNDFPPCSPEKLVMFQERIKHLAFRAHLPKNNWKRLMPILGELLKLRYHHFANGFSSVVRDLIIN